MPHVPHKPAAISALALTPLSDDEFETLADLLEVRSPFDTDGLFGVLHAVAVAPSLLPPSAWIPVVLPNGAADLDAATAQRFLGLVLRLHNEVLDAVNGREAIIPGTEDVAACESFANGYAAGAEIDPLWIGDADRWTFASCIAYLGGRLDLVPKDTLAKFDAEPDAKLTIRRDIHKIFVTTHDSFLKLRRAAISPPAPSSPAPGARVGRNDACPCGSGKKYKRCCLDRGRTLGAR